MGTDGKPEISLLRRGLIGTGLGLAALRASAASAASSERNIPSPAAPTAPFDSMRAYIAALESHGIVMHIPRVDQDAYEATALMYRIREQHGMRGAPTLIFDQVRIDGEWISGPLIVNESGHPYGECLIFGLAPVDEGPLHKEPYASYRRARAHVVSMLEANGGEYPTIAPVEVSRVTAACKQVVLTGDAIDLTRFPFIRCNPGDAGRYINTGVVYTRHPKYGVNIGTYRCHLRGPHEIGLNTEPGQTGHRHLMAAKRRGEKIAHVSIALTPDPYVWLVSGSKMSYGGAGIVDELSIAGGLAGRPLEIVGSETNEFMVPAHAEMIIEGEVPLDDLRPEGPYGEMAGHQGKRKDAQFWMRVTAVTHRRDPWIMNNFTGAQAGSLMAPAHARTFLQLQKEFPSIVDFYSDTRTVGITVASIRKARAGEGLAIARAITEQNFFAKVVIVVDDDVDVTNHEQILAALGTRWQPWLTTKLYESLPSLPIDPSTVTAGRGSKIAIDATRQWPEEGGPDAFPPLNETLLIAGAPKAFGRVDRQWGERIRDWRPKPAP